jgi:sulfatase maturation enzyme AslB (radical SAM superfamily)
MKKKYSCEDLQGSIYFAPNVIRNCCQRFFVNGKQKGDVEILKVKNDNDIDYKKIIAAKKKIITDLNENKASPCDGCPKIQLKEWAEEIKIKKISIEAHSKCNARCSYCSDMFYGGLNPNYSLELMLDNFRKDNFFEDSVAITWGGGEPVLLKNFDSIFKKFIESKYPRFDDIRVYSNSIIYNKLIHQYLDEKKIILTTSTDAGTQKTFELVRGVKKGFLNIFENLQKYNEKNNSNIIIKYILTNENYNKHEIDSFVNLIDKYKLLNCNFEISTDYKLENLDLEKSLSIIYFYNILKKKGADFVHFDDHVRKRIYSTLEKEIKFNDLDQNEIFNDLRYYFDKEIIVWGTGRYAQEVIEKSFLFKKSKVAFYVDKFFSEKTNKFIKEKVLNPKHILDSNLPIFIASSTYWHDIYTQIVEMGVNKKRIINTLIL